MGKCVVQVYFVEKWSKQQGLKISTSYFTFLYEVHFYMQPVLSVFPSTACVMVRQPVLLRLSIY